MKITTISGLGIALLLGPVAPASAAVGRQDDPELTVRVLIDVSGSMKKNDPANLRVPALRLLTQLLPDGANAGVWLFGNDTEEIVPPGTVNTAWKQTARDAAARIHSRSMHTDIERALLQATKDWNGQNKGGHRELILLTDGIVDVAAGEAESGESRMRILSSRLPLLQRAGVQVHTIALSKQADADLMQALAAGSDAHYEMVEDSSGLERAFLRIFEATTAPDSLPITNNEIRVDGSISELTLVVFRNPADPPTRILEPNGKPLSRDRPADDVRWHHERSYDLITVTDPLDGTWRIDARGDPDNRALIITDMKLHTSDLSASDSTNGAAPLTIELLDGEQRIDNEALLKATTFTVGVSDPGGNTNKVAVVAAAENPGLFEAVLPALQTAGRYDVVVTATSPTFTRERRQSISATPGRTTAPAAADQQTDLGHAAIEEELAAGGPADADNVAKDHPIAASKKSSNVAGGGQAGNANKSHDAESEQHTELAKNGSNVNTATVEARGGSEQKATAPLTKKTSATPDKTAKADGGGIDKPKPESTQTRPAVPRNYNWLFNVFVIIGFNLVIAAAGYFGYRRWHKRPDLQQALEAL